MLEREKLVPAFAAVKKAIAGKVVNHSMTQVRHATIEGLRATFKEYDVSTRMNFGVVIALFACFRLFKAGSLALVLGEVIAIYAAIMFIYMRMGDARLHRYRIPGLAHIGYRWALTNSEQHQSDLERRFYSGKRPSISDAIGISRCGIVGVKCDVYDCIAIAGLSVIHLINEKFQYPCEVFHPTGQGNLLTGHAYCVINRTCGDPLNYMTWNDDCYIFDPWYDVLISIKEAKKFPGGLLNRYPLLRTDNKWRFNFNPADSQYDRLKEEFAGVMPDYRAAPASVSIQVGLASSGW
jgi:hypothetical protein